MSLICRCSQVTSLLARILSIVKTCSHQRLSEQGDFPEAFEGGRGDRAYMAPPTSRPPPQSSSEKPALHSPAPHCCQQTSLPGFPPQEPHRPSASSSKFCPDTQGNKALQVTRCPQSPSVLLEGPKSRSSIYQMCRSPPRAPGTGSHQNLG